MSTFYGTAYDLENLPLPAAAVDILSSTNASPTVITTDGPHDLQTGFIVIITGHATNTNANGIWVVTVLTSDTLKISTIAGFPGTFINGNGVGGNTGTVQSLGMPGITLPEDFVTDIDAAAWNVPVEALADMVAWLAYRMQAKLQILKGGALTLLSGAAGLVSLGATLTVNGIVNIVTDGITSATLQLDNAVAQFINGTVFKNYGDEAYSDPQRLTNADHTISAHDGQIVILDKPTSQRTITVEQATDPPTEGQYIVFWMWDPPTVGNYYRIKREGSGNYIVELNATIATMQEPCFCRIHVESGVWRLTGGVGLSPGSDA